MKRSVVTALVIAITAVVWILSGQFDVAGPERSTGRGAAEPTVEERPIEVRVERFTVQDYRSSTVVTGRTAAVRRVGVRAQTTGQIEEIGAAEGASVAHGDLIARIGMRDRGARLAEAEALVAQRRSELDAARKLAEKGYRAQTQLAADQAEYDQAMARLKQIQVEIEETRVRAPFDGVLEERAVEVGDYVEPGAEIGTVVDLDPIIVVASVNERAVGGLTIGTPGRARLVTGEVVEGAIRYVASVASPDTRTFRVELQANNTEGRIRDGLTAELSLPGPLVEAHKIPGSVLTLSEAGEIGVKSVDDAGFVHFLPIRILADDQGGTWVAGLPATIELIVVGQEFAAEGERVETRPAAGESS